MSETRLYRYCHECSDSAREYIFHYCPLIHGDGAQGWTVKGLLLADGPLVVRRITPGNVTPEFWAAWADEMKKRGKEII